MSNELLSLSASYEDGLRPSGVRLEEQRREDCLDRYRDAYMAMLSGDAVCPIEKEALLLRGQVVYHIALAQSAFQDVERAHLESGLLPPDRPALI